MTTKPRTANSVDAFLDEHRKLAQKLAELRRWWDELDQLGSRKFGEMAYRIEELRGLLAEHFEEEERDGYLASALAIAPQYATQADDLAHEHVQFLERLDGLVGRLREAAPASEYWRNAREELNQLLADLRQHEHRENAIVQTAFGSDVAATD